MERIFARERADIAYARPGAHLASLPEGDELLNLFVPWHGEAVALGGIMVFEAVAFDPTLEAVWEGKGCQLIEQGLVGRYGECGGNLRRATYGRNDGDWVWSGRAEQRRRRGCRYAFADVAEAILGGTC